jgi:hypothetical protein
MLEGSQGQHKVANRAVSFQASRQIGVGLSRDF